MTFLGSVGQLEASDSSVGIIIGGLLGLRVGLSSQRCHEGNERLVSFLLLVFAALARQPLDSPRLPWAAHHQCVYCLAHILQNEIDDQTQDELGLHNPFPDHQRVWVHPPDLFQLA